MQLRTSAILSMVVLMGMFVIGFWQIMERSALVYGGTLTSNVSMFDKTNDIRGQADSNSNSLMGNLMEGASSLVNVFVAGVDIVLMGMKSMFNSISLITSLFLTAGGMIQMPPVILDALTALISIGLLYGLYAMKTGGGKV